MAAYIVSQAPGPNNPRLPERLGPNVWIEELKRQGINYGIIKDTITALSTQSKPLTDHEEILIAEGKAPIDEGISVEYFFTPMQTPEVDDKEQIDYKHLNYGCDVFEGQLIAEQKNKGPGEHGTNIFGEQVRYQHEVGKAIEYNQNVYIEKSSDGTRFYSKINGVLYNHLPGQLNISPEMHIRGNVGPHTGHISSKHPIIIAGDVRNGFVVRSFENIKINGTVEQGAIIESDKDIYLEGGVTKDTHIISKGNVSLRFAQGTHIECYGDLTIHSYLYDSDVRAKGTIRSLNQVDSGTKGTVIGGIINAVDGIELFTVGSPQNPTTLVAGIDFFYLKEANHIEKRIKEINEESKRHLRKVNPNLLKGDILKAISQFPEPDRVHIKRQIKHLLGLKKAQKELSSHLSALKSRNFGKNSHATIKIHKSAYPDVKVNISGFESMIYDKHQASIWHCDGEKIKTIQS